MILMSMMITRVVLKMSVSMANVLAAGVGQMITA